MYYRLMDKDYLINMYHTIPKNFISIVYSALLKKKLVVEMLLSWVFVHFPLLIDLLYNTTCSAASLLGLVYLVQKLRTRELRHSKNVNIKV